MSEILLEKLKTHSRSKRLFKAVVLNLYKHAELLRNFPSFCRTPFLPNIIERKNRLLSVILGKNGVRFPVGLVSRTCLAVEPLKRLRRTLRTR